MNQYLDDHIKMQPKWHCFSITNNRIEKTDKRAQTFDAALALKQKEHFQGLSFETDLNFAWISFSSVQIWQNGKLIEPIAQIVNTFNTYTEKLGKNGLTIFMRYTGAFKGSFALSEIYIGRYAGAMIPIGNDEPINKQPIRDCTLELDVLLDTLQEQCSIDGIEKNFPRLDDLKKIPKWHGSHLAAIGDKQIGYTDDPRDQSYEAAINLKLSGKCDLLSFSFGNGYALCAFMQDDLFDEQGNLTSSAKQLIQRFDSYTEKYADYGMVIYCKYHGSFKGQISSVSCASGITCPGDNETAICSIDNFEVLNDARIEDCTDVIDAIIDNIKLLDSDYILE